MLNQQQLMSSRNLDPNLKSWSQTPVNHPVNHQGSYHSNAVNDINEFCNPQQYSDVRTNNEFCNPQEYSDVRTNNNMNDAEARKVRTNRLNQYYIGLNQIMIPALMCLVFPEQCKNQKLEGKSSSKLDLEKEEEKENLEKKKSFGVDLVSLMKGEVSKPTAAERKFLFTLNFLKAHLTGRRVTTVTRHSQKFTKSESIVGTIGGSTENNGQTHIPSTGNHTAGSLTKFRVKPLNLPEILCKWFSQFLSADLYAPPQSEICSSSSSEPGAAPPTEPPAEIEIHSRRLIMSLYHFLVEKCEGSVGCAENIGQKKTEILDQLMSVLQPLDTNVKTIVSLWLQFFAEGGEGFSDQQVWPLVFERMESMSMSH